MKNTEDYIPSGTGKYTHIPEIQPGMIIPDPTAAFQHNLNISESVLNDLFAAIAMNALIQCPLDATTPIAVMAYNQADEMMAERQKRLDQPKEPT